MEINRELNNIISQHHIDLFYPGFQKSILAETLISKLAKKMSGKRVLCIGVSKLEIDRFKVLFCHEKTAYICCEERNCNVERVENNWNDSYKSSFDISPLTEINNIENNEVILIHKGALKILDYLRGRNIKFIELYDFFESEGLFLDSEYWKVFDIGEWNITLTERSFNEFDGVNLEIRNCFLKYESAIDERLKLINLRKLFFLALYARNFVFAKKKFELLMGYDFPEKNEYEKAWEEIDALINRIRKSMASIHRNDVICLWVDDVSQNESKEIHILDKIKEKGVWFNNPYTSTPFTNPTYRLLFTGKKVVDDESFMIGDIDETNSELLRHIQEKGYQYKAVGEYFKSLSEKYKTNIYHPTNSPCSKLLWDTLEIVLSNKSPVFTITHMVQESHSPCWSTDMGYEEQMRKRKCLNEVSEQLTWYSRFVNTESTYIIFSDHGSGLDINDSEFHAFFSIYGSKIKPRVIDNIFSYEDFGKLICKIVDNGDFEDKDIEREYVLIQDMDLYNKELINQKFDRLLPLDPVDVLGYKGIITKEFAYLRTSIGEEWFGKTNQSMLLNIEWLMKVSPENEKQASSLRKIIMDSNVCSENVRYKLRYYEGLKKVILASMPKFENKIEKIRDYLGSLPENGVAIRGGGPHTRHLINYFSKELKNIKYIIDKNPEASIFYNTSYSVITPDEIDKYNIRVVIISSKKHHEALAQECTQYCKDIKIIDIYEYLKKNGIEEDLEFYYMHPTIEEYMSFLS